MQLSEVGAPILFFVLAAAQAISHPLTAETSCIEFDIEKGRFSDRPI